jgi:predicted dehydrogenase
MKIMRGAIIGCGAIAREHLSAVSEIANVQMAAVCDVSAARAEATAERFGVATWYSNYQEMITDMRPNLVHITTPPASHFSIAKACLEAGLNVLCEKPITASYEEFCELKQLATRKHCLLLEDQNYRFHSSIRRICDLVNLGKLGDIVDVQIFLSLNVLARGSPYTDRNAPHFGATLRGGVIGDFLTHLAYLAYMFVGPVIDLRTTWCNRSRETTLSADEFRALIKGARTTAYVAFSGNAQPDGFWVRVVGSRMHAEANLFEPPRLTLRRMQPGEPALVKLGDGIAEARDVLKGTLASFCRKLGGVSSYDGLSELISRTYRALEKGGPPPIALEEIDEVASVVDRFTKIELGL